MFQDHQMLTPGRRPPFIFALAVVALAALPVFGLGPDALDRLRAQIQAAAKPAQGVVGVALKHLETGVELSVNGEEPFPMASTFKLPVLMTMHAQAQQGRLDWDEMVDIRRQDQHLGSGDLSYRYDLPGVGLSWRNLANLMMMVSDNSAADLCLTKVGTSAVNGLLRSLGVDRIRVDRSAQELILDYGGQDTARLKAHGLDELRGAMAPRAGTEEERFALDDRFAADERDMATPRAFVTLFEKLWRGEVIDRAASEAMLTLMKRSRTGYSRLRGLLPPETEVAHKTGSMGGVVDDVGIIYLPGDAGHLAIAVMTKRARASEGQVERVIAEIARFAYDYFYFTAAPAPAKGG